MSRMFIVGLLFISAVHICTGNSWIGSFVESGTCDKIKCCCAKSPIIFAKHGQNDVNSTIERKEAHCFAQTNLDLHIASAISKNSFNTTDDDSFLLKGGELLVNLRLNNGSEPFCSQTFKIQTSGGLSGNNTNSGSGNNTNSGSGNNTNSGSGNTTNPGSTGNDGSSKKGSLIIQLVSILMVSSILSMSR